MGDSGEFSRAGAASGHCQRSDILYREGLSLHLSWEESVKYQRCQVPPQTFQSPSKIVHQGNHSSRRKVSQGRGKIPWRSETVGVILGSATTNSVDVIQVIYFLAL